MDGRGQGLPGPAHRGRARDRGARGRRRQLRLRADGRGADGGPRGREGAPSRGGGHGAEERRPPRPHRGLGGARRGLGLRLHPHGERAREPDPRALRGDRAPRQHLALLRWSTAARGAADRPRLRHIGGRGGQGDGRPARWQALAGGCARRRRRQLHLGPAPPLRRDTARAHRRSECGPWRSHSVRPPQGVRAQLLHGDVRRRPDRLRHRRGARRDRAAPVLQRDVLHLHAGRRVPRRRLVRPRSERLRRVLEGRAAVAGRRRGPGARREGADGDGRTAQERLPLSEGAWADIVAAAKKVGMGDDEVEAALA